MIVLSGKERFLRLGDQPYKRITLASLSLAQTVLHPCEMLGVIYFLSFFYD